MILRIITRPTGPGTIIMDRINPGLLIALYFSAMTFISFNFMSSQFTDPNNSTNKDFSICTFNCNGFKGSYGYITELSKQYDVVFLNEHWLQVFEISGISNNLAKSGTTCFLKSSMDPLEQRKGRPYGGIGFLCRHRNDTRYEPIDIENERIYGLKVFINDHVICTIYGVYLPCNQNTQRNLDTTDYDGLA